MSTCTPSIKHPLGGILVVSFLVAWALGPNQSEIVACTFVKVINMSDMSGVEAEDQPRTVGRCFDFSFKHSGATTTRYSGD